MEAQAPASSSSQYSMKGDNCIKGKRCSKPTGKMAGQVSISPLLCPRPDFLGVGRGCGKLSIFSELIKLSGLSHNSSAHRLSTFNYIDNSIDNLELSQDDMVNSSRPEDHGDIQQANKKSVESVENNNYPVFKPNSTGKPTELVEYDLNDKTIFLFKTLEDQKIKFRTEIYRPKENRLNVDPNIFYCKNLFLKDRKGVFYLVICHEDQNADLKKLRKDLKAYRNFNFGTAQDMNTLLGVTPGGVTPLALMNMEASDVSMVICKSLLKEDATLMFHPFDSNLAVGFTMTDLLRFLKYFNHPVTFLKSS